MQSDLNPGSEKTNHLTMEYKENKCNSCGKRFGMLSKLQEHICIAKKLFTCQICEQPFKKKSGLKNNTTNVHEGEKDFKCPIYDKAFTQLGHFKHHTASVHEGK